MTMGVWIVQLIYYQWRLIKGTTAAMVLDSISKSANSAVHHQNDRAQSRKRDRKTAGLSFEAAASVTSSGDHTVVGSVAAAPPPPPSLSHDAPCIRDLSSPPSPKMPRLGMYDTYQPWVLQTYGDSAKTKTITKNKYQRILQILRGDYIDNETSKFKLWVKGRGFRIGTPPGYFQNVEGGAREAVGGLSVVGGQQQTGGVDYSPDKDPRPDIFVQTGTVKVRFILNTLAWSYYWASVSLAYLKVECFMTFYLTLAYIYECHVFTEGSTFIESYICFINTIFTCVRSRFENIWIWIYSWRKSVYDSFGTTILPLNSIYCMCP